MFIYLIANELLYSLSCRNLKKSVFNKKFFENKKLIISLIVLAIIQIIILTTGLSKYFIVSGLEFKNVIIVLSICLVTFIIGEIIKPLYSKIFRDYTEVKDEKNYSK